MNRFSLIFTLLTLALALGCNSGDRRAGPTPGGDGGGGVDAGATMTADGGGGGGDVDGGSGGGGTVATGGACDCDDDCAGSGSHDGLCVFGVCMLRASADCSAAGSTEECPAGSRCWGLSEFEGGICWPDCDTHSCDGTCDADGSCIPDDGTTCDDSCSEYCGSGGGGGGGECPPNSHPEGDGCVCDEGYTVNEDRTACVPACDTPADCSGDLGCTDGRCEEPPCTETSCPSGTVCASSGDCVVDIGTPPPGPPPACSAGVGDVPDWECDGTAAYCGELVAFEPDEGFGYWDYPINGETTTNEYRSYLRRDVMMLVKYAAAMVECQSAGWSFGNGEPIGLGDMSEGDGAIPGTSVGSPGHPAGTHVDGHDIDIAYYQTGTSDNRLRAVCEHTSGGSDAYHCTGEPTLLDPWRTALFLGHFHASPRLRVIGVDGRVGPLVQSALTQLCADGWLSGTACTSHRITWEETDTGRGWFRFHHHHLHLSVSGS